MAEFGWQYAILRFAGRTAAFALQLGAAGPGLQVPTSARCVSATSSALLSTGREAAMRSAFARIAPRLGAAAGASLCEGGGAAWKLLLQAARRCGTSKRPPVDALLH